MMLQKRYNKKEGVSKLIKSPKRREILQIITNHEKNNRLKINLIDLSRFVGSLRDSALNLF